MSAAALLLSTWLAICIVGMVVWSVIVVDSFGFWRALTQEQRELGSSYLRELFAHATIWLVMFAWLLIGVLVFVPGDSAFERALVTAGLFSGPVGLTLYGLYVLWRRRARG